MLDGEKARVNWRDMPYSGGFLLSNTEIEQVAHYDPLQLSDGWVFWCDPSKTKSFDIDQDQNFALIYGHWADASEDMLDHESTASRLLQSRSESERKFEEHLGRIAGRYVVVLRYDSNLFVYHDAMGVRSVYYSTTSDLICSHMNLLLEHEEHQQELSWEASAMSMDYTMYREVLQLLPNFRLDALTRRTERFFPRERNQFTNWSEDQILSRVEELWERVIESYAVSHPRTIISVTGGLDSRLMLAMSKKHCGNYASFTYGSADAGTTEWSRSMNQDYVIVRDLLPLLELRSHTFIEFSKLPQSSPELAAILKQNTIGKHGTFLIQAFRDEFESDGWLHIRGTGGEIVRRQLRGGTTFKSLLNAFTKDGAPPLEQRAVELGYRDHIYGYHHRDLAYWEVRMGKWHAEIMNEEDAAYDTLLPMSVREIFDLLLAFPEEERKTGRSLRELINRNFPVLNFIGANDRRNLYEQWRDEKTAERKATYYSKVVLSSPGEDRVSFSLKHPGELFIPREKFVPGTLVTGEIFHATQSGSLAFTLFQSFTSDVEREYFKWQVLVDDSAYLECSASLSSLPTHITVAGLQPDQKVKIGLVAARDIQQRESWERASRTRFKILAFTSGSAKDTGEIEVTSDSKHAVSPEDVS